VRWKLLDRVTELSPGARARGVLGVSFEMATLERPEPGPPGLPAVLALEAIAELAAWLVIASTDFRRRPLLGTFDRARLLARELGPGERLQVSCELERLYEAAALVSGRATSERGEVVAQVERAAVRLAPLEWFEDPEDVRAEYKELVQQSERGS
jgi:3-hydroxymyristoyl/3-hydroxydecanoyl-(acyl carrier protein) dehydratase